MKKNYAFFFAGIVTLISSIGSNAQSACSGIPASNTVVASSTLICPGSGVAFNLANTYSVTGIQFQWMSSTSSSVGPFTNINGATGSTYNMPSQTTSTVWYTALITCINGGGTIMAVPLAIQVQNTTTNTVPYYESFTGISSNGQLPNCSWFSPNLGSTASTYTNGGKYAGFYYSPSGASHMYTNGLMLHAGVVYSASVWYQTNPNYTTWSDLSILVGPNQNTTGLVNVASTNGPAVAGVYTALSHTFTVPTSTLYYIDVRGTSNGTGFGQYLLWDDLSITAPCSLNSPTIMLSPSQATICMGDSVTVTATGADTYSWSLGGSGNTLVASPYFPTNYAVSGTNTVTGCTGSASIMVVVNPAPAPYISVNHFSVCKGNPVTLNLLGPFSCTWSTGDTQTVITVTPNVTTTYSVVVKNNYGCKTYAAETISVLPLPALTITPSPLSLCAGESNTLTASGAGPSGVYQWASNATFYSGQTISISPALTTTYTLTGTDANGCQGKVTFVQTVNACLGIDGITAMSGDAKLYPNPNPGYFTVEVNNGLSNTVEVTDLTGRVVASNSSKDDKFQVNISTLANGIYYVKVQSNNAVEVIKVVKH